MVFLSTAGLFHFIYKIYRAAKKQNERIKSENRASQSEAQKESQNAKRNMQQIKLVTVGVVKRHSRQKLVRSSNICNAKMVKWMKTRQHSSTSPRSLCSCSLNTT